MATRAKVAAEVTLFDKLRADVKLPEPLKVTEDITLYCPTKKQLEASQVTGLSEEESNRILIGEHYDAIVAMFDDLPPHMWVEFNKTYLNHFFEDQGE